MDARSARATSSSQREPGFTAALRHLYGFMSPHRKRQFYRVLLLMLLGAVAELATIGAVVPFLSLLSGGAAFEQFDGLADFFGVLGAQTRNQQIAAAAVLFMIAAVLAGAIRLSLAWSSDRFVLGLGHDVAVEIQRRTLLQPYSFHISRNSSEIIASLEKVQVLVSGVLLQLMQAATAVFLGLFIIAALVQIDAFTAAVAGLALGALYMLVSVFTRRRLAENSSALGAAYGQRVQIIQESLGGIRDVIIDHSQQVYLDAFRAIDRRFTQARANTAFIASAPRFVIEAAGLVVIAGAALAMSARDGGLQSALPILGAFALGAQRLLPLMQQLYRCWASLRANRAITGQVLDLMRLPVAEEDPGAEIPRPMPFNDRIRLDQVSFAYAGRHKPVLDRITMEIPHGARIAIVGKSGSGKTTLVDLLMGLLEPTAGQITVDGVRLGAATRRAWQQGVAHVPQAIFLADTSIARNIALGVAPAELDTERVAKAARTAQLDEFIASLPSGYDTRVGERGVQLSGGQRQRLGIARAIYKAAPVLIFDEATSALDDATEAAVLEALKQLGREGCTIIVVAHRRSTIETCQLVARIEGGRLVEYIEQPR